MTKMLEYLCVTKDGNVIKITKSQSHFANKIVGNEYIIWPWVTRKIETSIYPQIDET